MIPRLDVLQYDLLKITTGDALEIEKHVIAVVSEVLADRQRPGNVGAAITDKNGLLDTSHAGTAHNIGIALLAMPVASGIMANSENVSLRDKDRRRDIA